MTCFSFPFPFLRLLLLFLLLLFFLGNVPPTYSLVVIALAVHYCLFRLIFRAFFSLIRAHLHASRGSFSLPFDAPNRTSFIGLCLRCAGMQFLSGFLDASGNGGTDNKPTENVHRING